MDLVYALRKTAKQARLLWSLYRDPRTPKSFRICAWLLVIYLVMPVDLIPDYIPGLGQIDDLLVAALGIKILLKLCPPRLVQEHKERIRF